MGLICEYVYVGRREGLAESSLNFHLRSLGLGFYYVGLPIPLPDIDFITLHC